ncbi:hypothetical protein COB55_05705 [Candidatus Wolfebacteria bacterium]|nr:MAG: hypothetical protein COB55_05705 [Candidatus Wolfebacteria bacterium]
MVPSQDSPNKKYMNTILKYFLGGVITLIPLFISYKIIQSVAWISREFFPQLNILFAFAISFFSISLLGYFVTKKITSSVKNGVAKKSTKEGILSYVFKVILNLKNFSEKTKGAFENPVYFEISPGIQKIGFITNKDIRFIKVQSNEHEKITVYAPNPINFFGEMLIIEKRAINIIEEKERKNIPILLFTAGIFEKLK